MVNFDAPNNVDIYVHRIGRTCRSVDGSASGTALTLLTQENREFAFQLVKFFEASEQKVPPALRALGSGVTENERRGTAGLGYGSQNTMKYESKHDAFESYFEKTEKAQEGVPVGSSQGLYQTLYDATTNTYTMVSTQKASVVSQGVGSAASATLSGFVKSSAREVKDIPVSAYGGPEDEWDSSLLAMESALAAIQARRRKEGGLEEARVRSRSRSSHRRHRSRSSHHSPSRHHSRSRHNSNRSSHHSRSRSHSRSHRRSRSYSRSHRHHSHRRH